MNGGYGKRKLNVNAQFTQFKEHEILTPNLLRQLAVLSSRMSKEHYAADNG